MVGRTPYGYVDEEAREYVVTRPDTPTPWINYLGEGRYGGIVSNTGGGYSFDRDPRSRRVSRYRYNGIPGDQPGRYVYLRDQETGAFWSVTWQPVRREPDAYECRHGAGYTRIATEHGGIASELLYFVAAGRGCARLRAVGSTRAATPATGRAGCAASATSSSRIRTPSSTSRTSTGRSTSCAAASRTVRS